VKYWVSKHRLVVLTALAYAVTLALDADLFWVALGNMWLYVREMLEILPAVFVLSALITVWVPPSVIMENFGASSGVRGKLISVLVGSVSAGPIYAAFPVTQSLLQKGASLGNVVVIISAWAVVKVPMLIVEARFLGIEFAFARYLFTVPAIMAIGALVAARTSRDSVLQTGSDPGQEEPAEEITAALPGLNCGACGYDGCRAFGQAVSAGEQDPDSCTAADEQTRERIRAVRKKGEAHRNGPDRG